MHFFKKKIYNHILNHRRLGGRTELWIRAISLLTVVVLIHFKGIISKLRSFHFACLWWLVKTITHYFERNVRGSEHTIRLVCISSSLTNIYVLSSSHTPTDVQIRSFSYGKLRGERWILQEREKTEVLHHALGCREEQLRGEGVCCCSH